MNTIRCPSCGEQIESSTYSAHEAAHLEQNQHHGLTALPPAAKGSQVSLAYRIEGEGFPKPIDPQKDAGQEPREFVVIVSHSQSGRVFSPFIVCANDEAAARKMCQRTYLTIQSVEPHVDREGTEKPRTLQYGPPVSDRDFERDYGNRAAENPTPGPTPYLLAGIGLFLCGPLGAWFGWWAGSATEQRSDE